MPLPFWNFERLAGFFGKPENLTEEIRLGTFLRNLIKGLKRERIVFFVCRICGFSNCQQANDMDFSLLDWLLCKSKLSLNAGVTFWKLWKENLDLNKTTTATSEARGQKRGK